MKLMMRVKSDGVRGGETEEAEEDEEEGEEGECADADADADRAGITFPIRVQRDSTVRKSPMRYIDVRCSP